MDTESIAVKALKKISNTKCGFAPGKNPFNPYGEPGWKNCIQRKQPHCNACIANVALKKIGIEFHEQDNY